MQNSQELQILQDMLKPRWLLILSKLGCSAFGDSYHLRGVAGKEFALKRGKEPAMHTGALEKVLVLSRVCCLNTTMVLDAWTDEADCVNIVTEYCNLGNMDSYLEEHVQLSENEVLSIFAQTLLGLAHLHKKNVVHRNIKLTNVLLHYNGSDTLPTVKLADYGLATPVADNAERGISRAGTFPFVPPEVADGSAYTTKADIWCLGVVLYAVLTRRFPFVTCLKDGVRGLHYATPDHPCAWRPEACRSESVSRLGDGVMAMLQHSWQRRPSAEELLQNTVLQPTLRNPPWIKSEDRNAQWVVVRTTDVEPMTVFAESDTSAVVVRKLTAGDHVLVRHVPLSTTTKGSVVKWVEVILPVKGYLELNAYVENEMRYSATHGLALETDQLLPPPS